MSRIIATESPGKHRNQLRRTIAEALRRLSQKPQLDDETKDMVALIVFCLHGIANTIDRTIEAWEKRDYYLKAERFRQEWRWLEPITDELSATVYKGHWDDLPVVLAKLMPHFADVKIKKMTRNPVLWKGAFEKFVSED